MGLQELTRARALHMKIQIALLLPYACHCVSCFLSLLILIITAVSAAGTAQMLAHTKTLLPILNLFEWLLQMQEMTPIVSFKIKCFLYFLCFSFLDSHRTSNIIRVYIYAIYIPWSLFIVILFAGMWLQSCVHIWKPALKDACVEGEDYFCFTEGTL